MKAHSDLPAVAAALSRLIPRDDREWMVGDLLEASSDRTGFGVRRTLWVCREMCAIAAGLILERAGRALQLLATRDVAAGVLAEGRSAWRQVRRHPGATVAPALALAAAATLTVLVVATLVTTLLARHSATGDDINSQMQPSVDCACGSEW